MQKHTLGYLQWMAARPWLMRKEDLHQMAAKIARGETMAEAQIVAANAARELKLFGSVAVIPILGPIMHRSGWWSEYFGLTSCQQLRNSIRMAMANDEVKAIVFEVDSPGGEVDGTPELAAEIFGMRGQKPMISVVNTMQCSAAHWIGCQADEIIMSPSASAGSIGCWTLHMDYSALLEAEGIKPTFIFAGEHKVDGNYFEPLSDEARAHLQASVNEVHKDFLASVAKARGTTAAAVRESYGEGKVYSAKQSIKLGVADRIAPLDQVLVKLNGSRSSAGKRADDGWWKAALAELPTEPIVVDTAAAKQSDEPVEPDADGNCPEGYEKGDDGQCYLVKQAATVDQAAIDRDELELTIAETDAL